MWLIPPFACLIALPVFFTGSQSAGIVERYPLSSFVTSIGGTSIFNDREIACCNHSSSLPSSSESSFCSRDDGVDPVLQARRREIYHRSVHRVCIMYGALIYKVAHANRHWHIDSHEEGRSVHHELSQHKKGKERAYSLHRLRPKG